MHPNPTSGPDTKNLMIAIVFATAIMFGWQYFYERPRQIALEATRVQQAALLAAQPKAEWKPIEERHDASADAPRITINTPSLHGSISTVGARFDTLTLAQYRESQAADAPEVALLKPAKDKDAYFIELGMLAHDGDIKMPDATTHWQTNDTELTVEKPVTLTWNNGSGLSFTRTISVDEHYMFTIKTSVSNAGAAPVTLYPYGLVSRNYPDTAKHIMFMHEGPLGVMNNALEDITYKTLREDGAKKFSNTGGWLGITDKYWLTALVPEAGTTFDAEYKHFKRGELDAYQADMRAAPVDVPVGKTVDSTMRLFAGAKVVDRLDGYLVQYNIPLFDRAVDFGSLYFLTRPIFTMLNFFYGIVGNFGIAIILLTCCIKALLFPLANKSMTSMARMKLLTPKMTEIRERYSDDKMRMNQEIMAMYKREKVNPVAGCLPILLQIPVFLALYRVLFVTIEMRQAPFYGWIHDLSVADPTNIFTAFGLLPWTTPSFLHLGVLPIIMCLTMVIQQRLNPKPADPVQAAMMSYMPYLFLFMFSSFPAGLVIYWVVNNTLSILQQLFINARLAKKGLK